ncbi:MAG: toll/interleukin-1 receptor domain-containing protein, partial [Chloroflexi bacterium]|nr:toll/interleukin-1 receptor domain-containing protein [Chloroflexota bacterium]
FIDADLSGARVGSTSFAGCDLSSCRGLATVEHLWPSSIGLDTLTRTLRGAGGRWSPEMVAFFTGAGVAPAVLDHLTQQYAADPTQFTACVVTHAAADIAFATRLQEDLRAAGIRCYRHQEMATGPGIFASMDRATPIYDKLIVVCSQSGLQRPHVIHELEQALEEETALRQQKQTNPAVDAEIIFLLRLDDYLETGWQHPAKEECLRHPLGDCRGWNMDEAVYLRALHALIVALRQRPDAPK